MLDNVALKELLGKRSDARRASGGGSLSAVRLREERAAGVRVLGTDRSAVRYLATRPDDGVVRKPLKALAKERRRFGYRRLLREGNTVNKKRVQRLCREETLTVRRRRRLNGP